MTELFNSKGSTHHPLVAVKAIMFTLGSMLQTSPRLQNAVQNESPLNIHFNANNLQTL